MANEPHALFSSPGVTVVYTPDGVTKELLAEGLENFPAPGQILGPSKKTWW